MTFAVPWMAYVAAATPLLVAILYAVDFTRRRRTLDRIGDPVMLARMLDSLSVRRRVTKAILHVVALTCVVTAAARPQVEGESTWRQRGIDIAMVVDFSRSMLAEDVYPSRFRRTRLALDELLTQLEADRVAVVASAGAAEYFPLSHDPEALRAFLADMVPGDLTPGSDLGGGVRLARCIVGPDLAHGSECRHLARGASGGAPLDAGDSVAHPVVAATPGDDRARAIVIFTDGEDTGGALVPEVAAAAASGIHVFLIGVGTEVGELIPVLSADGERTGWETRPGTNVPVTTRLDRARLNEARRAAGALGELFILDSKTFRTDDLIAKLQSLKKGNLDQRVVRTPVEVYHWFLFPALLLLIIEACIRDRRRRRA